MEVEAQVVEAVEAGITTIEVHVGNTRDGFHRARFQGRELAKAVSKPAPGVAHEPNPHSGHFKPELYGTYRWSLWATTGGRFALHFVESGKPGGQLVVVESWGYLRRQFGIPEEVAAAVTDELLRDRVVLLDV